MIRLFLALCLAAPLLPHASAQTEPVLAAALRVPAGADTIEFEAAAPYVPGAVALELWVTEPGPARALGRVLVEPTGGEPGVWRRQSFPFPLDHGLQGRASVELRHLADSPDAESPVRIRNLALARRGPRDPFLKTDGIFLRNARGKGDIVRLRGVNLGGWLLQESFMSPIPHGWDEYRVRAKLTERFGADRAERLVNAFQDAWIVEEDFARMAAAGLNSVRIPIHWQNHMHEDGSFKRLRDGSIDFSRIDQAVQAARRHGMYSILDLHGAPGSQNGRDHSGDRRGPLLWDSPAYREQTKTLWREIARRYRHEHAVAGYDLLNEPARTNKAKSWDQGIIDFVSELYRVVRSVDPDHVVFFSVWSEHYHVGNLTVGKTNYVLAYHWYIYKRYLDEGGTEAGFWEERLAKNARISRDQYDAPFYLGEFSFKDGPEAWGPRMELFTRHGIGWAKWAYKTRSASQWGLYEARRANDANIPDFEKDDYATILRKWSSWRTDSEVFTPDSAVIDSFRRAAALDPSGPVVFPTTR